MSKAPPGNRSEAASPSDPAPSPWQLSERKAFLQQPHRAVSAAGLGWVVGQGWGCPMVAGGDISKLVPGIGPLQVGGCGVAGDGVGFCGFQFPA